jgi:hypothetical protein
LAWSLSFILAISLTVCFAIASLTLGLPKVAYAQSTQKTGSTETTAVAASDPFRQSSENRYTWDEQFPGYCEYTMF